MWSLCRRSVVFLALVVGLLGPVPEAGAATQLTVTPSSAAPGATISVVGSGFPGRSTVTLTWNVSSAGMPQIQTRRSGTFRLDVTIPSGASAGAYPLLATAGGVQATATVQVTGSGPAPSPTPTRTPTASPTAPPVPTQPPSGSPQERLLTLVNDARRQQGLQPVSLNAALGRAAQQYAETMASSGCFSHSCPPEPSMVRRAEAAGYTNWTNMGENIAFGQRTEHDVHQAWMSSSGHRANILNPAFKDLGVGLAYNGSGRPYWVQSFGARR